MHDAARIHVEGGAGGNGVVSFRREAHVPRGGPDGGDGARGGDVVLVCDASRRDLSALRHAVHHRGKRGGHGEGALRHGRRGADVEIPVPPGTQVVGLDGAMREVVTPGERIIVARGGGGGRGNKRFANSTRQAPRFAEKGLTGESGWIELRLKLIADAGLVGLPNAGKSSLLAALTRATPRVADYPFTTLEPALGTLQGEDGQLVLADIPGLIEGAAGGAGLGHEFLAHIERCRILVHVVELAPLEGDPAASYRTVRGEIGAYEAHLAGLPEIIVLSKRDLMPQEEWERAVAHWRADAGPGVRGVLAVSAATGAGLDDLKAMIFEVHREVGGGVEPEGGPAAAEFASEHRVYTPAGEDGFRVVAEDGAYRVEGRGVEMLAARHDLANEEALAYLEERLFAIGVVAALRAAGFEDGDELRIGEVAFDFVPAR